MSKKGKHTTVEKSLRPEIAWLESLTEVKKVILGISDSCRHSYPPGHLKLQGETDGGLRLNGYSGSGVTRVFVRVDEENRDFVLGCLVLAGGMVFIYMMSLSRKGNSSKTESESELNQDKTTQPPNRICTSLACDWVSLVDDTLEGEVQKKRIIIMKCNECGAMDKTIESVDLQSKKTWKTIKEK